MKSLLRKKSIVFFYDSLLAIVLGSIFFQCLFLVKAMNGIFYQIQINKELTHPRLWHCLSVLFVYICLQMLLFQVRRSSRKNWRLSGF
jgi:hypothetical protein